MNTEYSLNYAYDAGYVDPYFETLFSDAEISLGALDERPINHTRRVARQYLSSEGFFDSIKTIVLNNGKSIAQAIDECDNGMGETIEQVIIANFSVFHDAVTDCDPKKLIELLNKYI